MREKLPTEPFHTKEQQLEGGPWGVEIRLFISNGMGKSIDHLASPGVAL